MDRLRETIKHIVDGHKTTDPLLVTQGTPYGACQLVTELIIHVLTTLGKPEVERCPIDVYSRTPDRVLSQFRTVWVDTFGDELSNSPSCDYAWLTQFDDHFGTTLTFIELGGKAPYLKCDVREDVTLFIDAR